MNMCDAFVAGREVNKAIERSSWLGHLYVFHGMDNVVMMGRREGDCRSTYCMCVADLLADDWCVADAPYHGYK